MVNHPNRSKLRTNPDHKCAIGYTTHCSCGWQSDTFFEGGHARRSALAQWRGHREECEKREATER